MASVYPVIMCGGVGTRLWPMSHRGRPKQFAPLLKDGTLFSATVERCRHLTDFKLLTVVTNIAYADTVHRLMRQFEMPYRLVLEPAARDSGPAVACAVHSVLKDDEGAMVVLLASDHHIPDTDHFVSDINKAMEAASSDAIVLLGITPTEPSSAYGYIQPNYGVDGTACTGSVVDVEAFHEKPAQHVAQDYINKSYLWNSGNFIASAATLKHELETHAPQLWQAAKMAVDDAHPVHQGIVLGEAFNTIAPISIDFAVMEKTINAKVLPTHLPWSDLGSWDAVRDMLPADGAGNVTHGDALFHDSERCLVHHDGDCPVVTIGLHDIGIVVEEAAILVLDLNRSQEVKAVVSQFEGRESKTSTVAPRDPLGQLQSLPQWLAHTALPLWTSVGRDHQNKLWREGISADAQGLKGPVRARVQTRQMAVLGMTADWWDGPSHSFLDDDLRRIDHQLRPTLTTLDGTILDPAVKLYDQAFTLFALAQMPHDLGQRHETATKANALLGQICNHFAGDSNAPLSQLRETGALPCSTNPMMHLFEACLAWAQQEADGRLNGDMWHHRCEELAQLAQTKLFDGRYIREHYADDWALREDEAGQLIDPGHQYEWAWLLLRWAELSGPTSNDWEAIAYTLYDTGNDYHIGSHGLVPLEANRSTKECSNHGRLWSQLERLRTALVMADRNGGRAFDAHIREAGEIITALMETAVPGLWNDRMEDDGTVREDVAPASTLYHITGLAAQIRKCSWRGEEIAE